MLKYILVFAGLLYGGFIIAQAPKARITEEKRTLKTYPFSDPDPLPILTSNPKIYPYHRFDGYSLEGQPQDWKTVKLENEFVEVYVLPEVGGKVWGAIEKSTGEEFIYRNEVMKFRNIAMRGPWTSGGIEFNFGIIGHHPGTATPVDYIIQEEADGSVSCIVGNIDLPSRTQWRVKIRLPKDKAYFETAATWYNPTPLQQAYYNWMTAAAAARQDLEFFTPGNQYLEHSGKPMPWPYDNKARHLAAYKENNFGPSKSYHVVGKEHDFFGGYFHDSKFGFGHWAEYEEMPGQKLWLWALSRSGGIWEDLLTDTDGQYIEFQAGRLLVQYSPGGDDNPVTQANFPPYTTDQWTERWFPIKEIGGLSEVSEQAVLHLSAAGSQLQLQVGINALSQTKGSLQVRANGKLKYEEAIDLAPMEVYNKTLPIRASAVESVSIKEMDLHLSMQADSLTLNRPFLSPAPSAAPSRSAEQSYLAGMEDMKFRLFTQAIQHFEDCLEMEPRHLDAYCQLAELHYRKGDYKQGLAYAQQALRWDTYHPQANYMAGVIYRAKGDFVNAKESLAWAARSMAFRSAAYGQMAEIYLQEKDITRAGTYAKKSLDFNRYNINALQVLAIQQRRSDQLKAAQETLQQLRAVDPLNHLAFFEAYLLDKTAANRQAFLDRHRSEFPVQTFLELAIDYHNKGQAASALEVLALTPKHPLIQLWQAYLQGNDQLSAITTASSEFVFPFRRETIDVLEWATQQSSHWKLKYYLALNYWGKEREKEAAALLQACGNEADFAPFYLSRAHLLEQQQGTDPWADLQRASLLSPTDWRIQRSISKYLQAKGKTSEALAFAQKAYQQHPANNAIGMDYARLLIASQAYENSIKVLKTQHVLPFEGASEGRKLFEQAHLGAALQQIKQKQYQPAISLLKTSKEWPEQLGVGKPYDTEERMSDFLLALCHEKLGDQSKSKALYEAIVKQSKNQLDRVTPLHLLGLLSAQKIYDDSAAKRLLQALHNENFDHQPIGKWVSATFNHDTQALAQLQYQQPQLLHSTDMKLLSQIVGLLKS